MGHCVNPFGCRDVPRGLSWLSEVTSRRHSIGLEDSTLRGMVSGLRGSHRAASVLSISPCDKEAKL